MLKAQKKTKQVCIPCGRMRTKVKLSPGWRLAVAFQTYTKAVAMVFLHGEGQEKDVDIVFSNPGGSLDIRRNEDVRFLTAFPIWGGKECLMAWEVTKKKVGKECGTSSAPSPERPQAGSSATSE